MNPPPAVPLAHRAAELRQRVAAWRARGLRVAFAPTMGALHDGHLSLVAEGKQRAERVIVSIFVNPAQFGPGEDFAKYPRTLEADLARLSEIGADLCYAPLLEEIYPPGFATRVLVEGPAAAGLEDRFRPEHFSGVATVVAKLLNQARADVAIFGEKDYQQLLVVRRLAADLDIETRIVGAPTLREADGLAMSSRNVYLSPDERHVAPALHRTLNACARRIGAGEPIEPIVAQGRTALAAKGFAVDYLEARDAESLRPVEQRRHAPLRLLAAARLGATRLIDNLAA